MIAAQVIVHDGITEPLERFGAKAPRLLDQVIRSVGYQYRAHVRKNYLSGGMLNRNSGDLYRSMVVGMARGRKHVVLVGSKKVTSRQSFGGVSIVRQSAESVKLANIYEHAGGYTITPKNKKVLVFGTPDGIVFTKRVQGRERPFMSQSVETFRWASAFDNTTDKVMREALVAEDVGVVR